MSACPNNGRPPVPSGAEDMRAQDPSVTRGGIVPFGTPMPDGEKRTMVSALAGVFFCALGGAVASSSMSIVAPALVGYGFVVASLRGELREKVLAAAAAVATGVALNLTSGIASIAGAMIVCLAALAVAGLLVEERMTPGSTCACVAAITACRLGVDAALAASSGTTLAAAMASLFDGYLQQFGSASIGAAMQAQTVSRLLAVLWPMTYVVVAVGEYLFAQLGVRLAVGRTGERVPRLPQLVDYDLPLWVVAVLVAAVAGLAVELTVSALASDVALMVAANVVVALRFAFAAQGLAVLAWFIRARRVGPFASALLGVAAFYLEVQFVVLTIVGLVDVWTNFRHLERGKRVDVRGATEQD